MTDPAGISRLPGPGTFEHYVLVSPWVAMGALGVAGFAALVILNTRARAGLGLVLLGVAALLAAGVYLASTLVETTGEKLAARTRDLVDACVKVDESALRDLVSTDVVLDVPVSAGLQGLDGLLSVLRQYIPRYEIREHSVGALAWSIDGDNAARTRARVTAEPEATRLPHSTWLLISWRKTADGQWKVRTITAEQIDGVPSR